MLEHGGRLREGARRWGIPPSEWLDLSTSIAPWAYPVPPLPVEVWQRLPEDDDGLEDAARACYGAQHLLPLAGSQAAIQALPRLFAPGRVALPAPLYAEHAAAWRAAGHTLVDWQDAAEYAVLCNPNNPTGQAFSADCLRARLSDLRLMVVDEAFIDAAPGDSLAAGAGSAGHENLVVLRSLGKFFGLAGARVGFACAAPALLDRLARALGPWAVAHPARCVAQGALADTAWQSAQRLRLAAASIRLATLLRETGLGEPRGTALFQYLETPWAAAWHEALARRGILVRHFAAPAALRFGLPGNEAQWARLAAALEEIRHAAPAA
ncbi:MAG: threonine-phosphate decarboxylase [Betaproteobacteria bacterium]|nr:threonine-phosphate decarboxylase [Betaproteobacteria bacterium]